MTCVRVRDEDMPWTHQCTYRGRLAVLRKEGNGEQMHIYVSVSESGSDGE